MIGDAGGAYPAFPVCLHVYVLDVDERYRKALAAGGVDPDSDFADAGTNNRRQKERVR